MTPTEIKSLRTVLGLSQTDFARLFDVHFMTVSKWERGAVVPSPYQVALMEQFRRTAQAQQAEVQEKVNSLLVGAGVIAALFFLLSMVNK